MNTSRPHYLEALRRARIETTLADFDPYMAGTAPLGLDVPASDLDVVCRASDPTAFTTALWSAFSHEAGFSIHQWIIADRPVVASFYAHGPTFRAAVIRERLRGTKTEPAFAVVRLEGNPYDALLDLQDRVDEALIDVLKSAGFAT